MSQVKAFSKLNDYEIGDWVYCSYYIAQGYSHPSHRGQIVEKRPADSKPTGFYGTSRYWDEVVVVFPGPLPKKGNEIVAVNDLGRPHTEECQLLGDCQCFEERE